LDINPRETSSTKQAVILGQAWLNDLNVQKGVEHTLEGGRGAKQISQALSLSFFLIIFYLKSILLQERMFCFLSVNAKNGEEFSVFC